jgi:hypothetical protein
MNQGIIRADSKYRRKVALIYAALILLGVVIIGMVLPWAQKYLQRLEPVTALWVMKVVLIVMFLSIIPMALYLLAFGCKVLASGQFPPPGVKVIKDTRIIQGEKARVRGRVLVFLSIILMVLGLSGALYPPPLLPKLKPYRSSLRQAPTPSIWRSEGYD